MIKIREVFTAKPGMASKLAKLMQESMGNMGGKTTIMTDLVGDYNTVVAEYEMESMVAFEKMMEDYTKNQKPEEKEKMSGYTDMYMTGRREIYRIW